MPGASDFKLRMKHLTKYPKVALDQQVGQSAGRGVVPHPFYCLLDFSPAFSTTSLDARLGIIARHRPLLGRSHIGGQSSRDKSVVAVAG